MMHKIFILPMLLCTSSWAFADNSSQVVDLGQMSVSGDVRKPSISWIDSQKAVRDQIPVFLKCDFEEFEKTLIEHSSDQISQEASAVRVGETQ